MKSIRLPAADLAVLHAGQPLVLRRPLRPQPAPEAVLHPFEDLGTGERVWGYLLPPETTEGAVYTQGFYSATDAPGTPGHAARVAAEIEYADGTFGPGVGRCVTWMPPWQVGERLAVRLTGLVVEVVAVGAVRGGAGVWEWEVDVRRVEEEGS